MSSNENMLRSQNQKPKAKLTKIQCNKHPNKMPPLFIILFVFNKWNEPEWIDAADQFAKCNENIGFVFGSRASNSRFRTSFNLYSLSI